jgi:hypothetical protein
VKSSVSDDATKNIVAKRHRTKFGNPEHLCLDATPDRRKSASSESAEQSYMDEGVQVLELARNAQVAANWAFFTAGRQKKAISRFIPAPHRATPTRKD